MLSKTFISVDIEVVDKGITAIGVVRASVYKNGSFVIANRRSFYGKVDYDKSKLTDFWKENINKLESFQEKAVSQEKMAQQFENYISSEQNTNPNFILISDFSSFDIGLLNKLLESHGKKALRFRRITLDFFQDLDTTSFVSGVLFALDPKSAFEKGWEWDQYDKIFKKLGIKPNKKVEHDHEPVNDALKNLIDFLTLIERGVSKGIVVGKKRKREEENNVPKKKAKLV